MPKSSAVVHTLAMVLACAGFAVLSGCGSPQEQADRAAQDAMAQADLDRAKAQDLDALDNVQKTFDGIASDPNLSDQMKVLVRARQAELRMQRVDMRCGDLRTQELVITRDINDIGQLAMQLAGVEADVDALRSYDPAAQVAKLQAQRDQIAGSADAAIWMVPNPTSDDPSAKVTSPTLFAVNQEIQNLTQAIAQNQSRTDAEHKLSAAKGDEAEKYLRSAEAETGEPQVTDTTNAANDRRDAAYADNNASILANQLVQLQANLDRADAQKSALESAVKALDGQMQAQNDRWTTIQQQITAQQLVEQNLIASSSANSTTISSLAQDLAQNIGNASTLRESINGDLNSVITQLGTAITLANQLRGQWVTSAGEKPLDPDIVVWQQALETLHPANFNLQVASAMETRAEVAAAKARIDQLIYNLYGGSEVSAEDVAARFKNLAIPAANGPIKIPGLADLLKKDKTGIDSPKALADLPTPDSDGLKQTWDDVNSDFQEAIDTYDKKFGSTDVGAASSERRNLGWAGEAHVDREWAQVADFRGDASGADEHLKAAAEAEANIDPSFTLAVDALSPPPPTTPPAGGGVQ